MATTVRNDVQDADPVRAGALADGDLQLSGPLDLEQWKALQQRMMEAFQIAGAPSKWDSTLELVDEINKAAQESRLVAEAKKELLMEQAAINVIVENDGFIKDNITGK